MNYITGEMLCKFINKQVEDKDTSPESFCQSAMETVKEYLGYDPESQSYTQLIKGDGGALAALQAMPITEITALNIDGIEADPSQLECETENYVCFVDN